MTWITRLTVLSTAAWMPIQKCAGPFKLERVLLAEATSMLSNESAEG
jgi:hypothetical protein